MGTDPEPTSGIEKTNYFNRMDEAFGLICMSMLKYLIFHFNTASNPNDVWTKLEGLFRKHDEIRMYQLENELIALSPTHFRNLQEFFTKFKSFLNQLKDCNVDKKDEQIILSILSKLGLEYSVFISSFHASKLTTKKWEMPSLDVFIEALTQEQAKLISMGSTRTSKDHALVANEGQRSSFKDKHKGKGKMHPNARKEKFSKATEDS